MTEEKLSADRSSSVAGITAEIPLCWRTEANCRVLSAQMTKQTCTWRFFIRSHELTTNSDFVLQSAVSHI